MAREALCQRRGRGFRVLVVSCVLLAQGVGAAQLVSLCESGLMRLDLDSGVTTDIAGGAPSLPS
eukprot:6205605-Pleurochrysis_carterae.AAC.5